MRAEIASSDGIDLVIAFIRWSGVRPLADAIAAYLAIPEENIGDDALLLDDLALDSVAIPEIITLVSDAVGLEISYDESELFGDDLTLRQFVLALVFRCHAAEFGA